MAVLDDQIDNLYQQPLEAFTSARAALASTLKGDDARGVRQLKKPTNAPWAVNQVYWHARQSFDSLMKSGHTLRRAQIAALQGKTADLRGAAESHRQAISAAVTRAVEIAARANIHPDRDALSRTFEALSLAAAPPESPGRLTQPLQPGGFEMLAGVQPAAGAATKSRPTPEARPGAKPDSGAAATGTASPQATAAQSRAAAAKAKTALAAARTHGRELAAAARRRDAARRAAEERVARARATAAAAREAWQQAADRLKAAEHELSVLQREQASEPARRAP